MSSCSIHSMIDEPQLEHRQVDALAGGQRLAQEVEDRDAGDLLGVLEGQEHAGLAPHVGGPVGDVVALEADPAAGDLVLGAAEQGAGQRGLAGPVGAHEGVDLAWPTARSTPWRMSWPSAATCRSSISKRGAVEVTGTVY